MLVCDVELGNTSVQTGGARPEIDPERGTPIAPTPPMPIEQP